MWLYLIHLFNTKFETKVKPHYFSTISITSYKRQLNITEMGAKDQYNIKIRTKITCQTYKITIDRLPLLISCVMSVNNVS